MQDDDDRISIPIGIIMAFALLFALAYCLVKGLGANGYLAAFFGILAGCWGALDYNRFCEARKAEREARDNIIDQRNLPHGP